jgi:hypothetical protein
VHPRHEKTKILRPFSFPKTNPPHTHHSLFANRVQAYTPSSAKPYPPQTSSQTYPYLRSHLFTRPIGINILLFPLLIVQIRVVNLPSVWRIANALHTPKLFYGFTHVCGGGAIVSDPVATMAAEPDRVRGAHPAAPWVAVALVDGGAARKAFHVAPFACGVVDVAVRALVSLGGWGCEGEGEEAGEGEHGGGELHRVGLGRVLCGCWLSVGRGLGTGFEAACRRSAGVGERALLK